MRVSLHRKLLFSLIGLVAISLTGMGLALLHDAHKRLEEFKLLQAKSQVRTLADGSIESLLTKNYPVLEDLVYVTVADKHYEFAAIATPDGLILSHSDMDRVGGTIATSGEIGGSLEKSIETDKGLLKEIIIPIVFADNHLANAHIAYYTDVDYLNVRDLSWLLTISTLTMVLLILGSFLISKYFTKPMVELTSLVHDISEDNRLAIPDEILAQNDEVGELARSFKYMSDKLVDRLEELKQQIHEKDSATAANKEKSYFLANVSHELRTPLNAIIGYSELLMEEVQEEDEQKTEDLNKIRKSAKHLNRLINDMLDLSKIDAGKLDIVPEPVILEPLLFEINSIIRPLAKRNNNRFVYEFFHTEDRLITDPLRLKQIILNLLGNAAKFTNNGEIILTTRTKDNFLEFSIQDNGIGMNSEQLGKIFSPFTQADKKTTSVYGGTGLGLTITKRLCQLIGGCVSVHSEEGKGSTFTVLLPLDCTSICSIPEISFSQEQHVRKQA